MKKFFHSPYVYEVIVLILMSLIPLWWFTPGHMVIGQDSGYPVNFVQYFFNQRVFTWLGSENFGYDTVSWMGQYNLLGLLAFVRLFVPQYDVQKITFIFWFLSITFSMYFFSFFIFKGKDKWIARLLTVFIYVFNFHLFSFWVQGEQPTLSSYALLPFMSLALLKLFYKEWRVIWSAIFLNIVFFVYNGGGVLGVPLLGSSIFTGFVIFVYFLVFAIKEKQLKDFLKRTFFFVFISGAICFFLNFYFIYPFLSTFHQEFSDTVNAVGGIGSAIQWTKFISEFTSFQNLIRLQGDLNWYNHPGFYSNTYLDNPILILASFVFSLAAFSSVFFIKNYKERKNILLFILISLVGIFLSAGSHEPLGSLYVLFMEKVPGFAAFRSPYYKFVPILYFAFSVLIGSTMYNLISKVRYKKVSFVVSIIILLFVVFYHFEFFNRDNFIFEKPYVTMLHIPSYVTDLGAFEEKRDNTFRTLIVPPVNNYTIKVYSWGYWSPSQIFTGLTDKTFLQNDESFNQTESTLVGTLYQFLREKRIEDFKRLAVFLNVNEIILTSDVSYDHQKAPTELPSMYEKILSTSPFKKVWGRGKWSVYTWEGAVSKRIFSPSKISLKTGDSPIIDYSLRDLSDAFILQEDTTSYLLSQIQFQNNIDVKSCVSCGFLGDFSENDLTFPGILPGSKFYSFKIFLENLKTGKNKNVSIDQYVGLSLKRTSEIYALRDLEVSQISKSEWSRALELLYSNWEKIDQKLKGQDVGNDFAQLSRIYKFGQLEIKALSSVYDGLLMADQDPFKLKFAKNIGIISRVVNNASQRVKGFDSGTSFVYSLTGDEKDLLLDYGSLPADSGGNYVLPSSVSYDNKIETPFNGTLLSGSDVEFAVNHPNAKIISLKFNELPNLLKDINVKGVSFPSKTRTCIVGSIGDFKWNKSYLVSSDINIQSAFSNIYISTKRNSSTGYLEYDKSVDTLPHLSKHISELFSGHENDLFADVYFCTNAFQNPQDIYSNFRVTEMSRPFLYSKSPDGKNTNASVADISFKRINPTKYFVHVKSDKPFVLSFLERYSAFWRASINNIKVNPENHFQINGYANGWYINKTGEYEIELNFAPQEIFTFSGVVTIVSIISLAGIVTVLFLKRRFKK